MIVKMERELDLTYFKMGINAKIVDLIDEIFDELESDGFYDLTAKSRDDINKIIVEEINNVVEKMKE